MCHLCYFTHLQQYTAVTFTDAAQSGFPTKQKSCDILVPTYLQKDLCATVEWNGMGRLIAGCLEVPHILQGQLRIRQFIGLNQQESCIFEMFFP